MIDTEAEALRMIGRVRDARQFDMLAAATLSSFPQLHAWVRSHPRKLLEHASGWERVLAVLHWFVAHPRSAIYLRQLDIHGVDTKFIEARKGAVRRAAGSGLAAGGDSRYDRAAPVRGALRFVGQTTPDPLSHA